MTRVASRRLAPLSIVAVAWFVFGGAHGAGAESIWVHAKVEIQSTTGEQITRFRAFSTSDEAGTTRVNASRLCVKGIAYRVQEKCEENTSSIELVERTTDLPGLGSKCGEVTATAAGVTAQAQASARACP
jgi:hypothetical protein